MHASSFLYSNCSKGIFAHMIDHGHNNVTLFELKNEYI